MNANTVSVQSIHSNWRRKLQEREENAFLPKKPSALLEGVGREMRVLISQKHLKEIDLPAVIGHIPGG